jgi:TRAP-type C4-dicarboxylate transport system permease small subunit
VREKLRAAESALAAVEGAALVALLALMVSLAFAQVVLRRLGHGLLWGETLLKQLVLLTGFLGASLAAAREKHFAWEAAHMGASPKLQPWLRLVASLCAAAVCALLLKAGCAYAASEREAASTLMTMGPFEVPTWPFAAGIPGGFLLVGLHAAFKAADSLWDLRR